MLVTFSNKFTTLDSRESGLLENLTGDDMAAFESLHQEFVTNFRPKTNPERDTVYCLATLRWGIDRIRAAEDSTRATFRAHGYTTAKIKAGLDELAAYQRELNIRYEYFFAHFFSLRRPSQAA